MSTARFEFKGKTRVKKKPKTGKIPKNALYLHHSAPPPSPNTSTVRENEGTEWGKASKKWLFFRGFFWFFCLFLVFCSTAPHNESALRGGGVGGGGEGGGKAPPKKSQSGVM